MGDRGVTPTGATGAARRRETAPHGTPAARGARIVSRFPAPAAAPPEWRGVARDEVRLLVSDDAGHHHARFIDLPDYLVRGDLLVVNESATLPASLPARGTTAARSLDHDHPCGGSSEGRRGGRPEADGADRKIEFRLNLSTRFSGRLWLAEPRWSAERPGPMPWRAGDRIRAAGVSARLVMPFRGAPRLWFVAFDADIADGMKRNGEPIRYGYVPPPAPPLALYQTIFARVPGMPSAARPFTPRVLDGLRRRGVEIARIVLHTGVSSLDASDGSTTTLAIPEPFVVPAAAADAINRARAEGRRVIAVGTTVVRALESAATRTGARTAATIDVRATSGFSRLLVEPSRGVAVVDGLITGLHEPGTSHRALLEAVGGPARVRDAYEAAAGGDYLQHEFGDTHLLWS